MKMPQLAKVEHDIFLELVDSLKVDWVVLTNVLRVDEALGVGWLILRSTGQLY